MKVKSLGDYLKRYTSLIAFKTKQTCILGYRMQIREPWIVLAIYILELDFFSVHDPIFLRG